MTTISEEKLKEMLEKVPKWEEWSQAENPPSLKHLVELMIEYNTVTKDILQETRDWLITNGNR